MTLAWGGSRLTERCVSGPDTFQMPGTFCTVRVWDPDDRAFEHGGMGADRLLDFDAGDVLAAGDDDVLAAVAQFDVAVGMPHGKVTGMEPAAGERLGRGRLVAEVAAHDVVPAHDHLAHRGPVPGHVVHLLADDTDEIGGG